MNGIEDEVIEKKDLSRPYFPRKYGERLLLDLLCCFNHNCLLACLLVFVRLDWWAGELAWLIVWVVLF